MIRNIIFDWSGVLSNDLTPVYTATMNVFRRLGLKILTLEEYRKEFTLPYMEFYKKFKKDIKKEEADRLFSQEFKLVDKPKPFPGVKEILQILVKNNRKLVLLSSHPKENLENELIDHNFKKYFVDVNGGVHDKVKVIKDILKKNNFDPKETAYVGDMPHDVEVGKAAGVIAVAVCWGYKPKGELLKEKPDYMLSEIRELKIFIPQ